MEGTDADFVRRLPGDLFVDCLGRYEWCLPGTSTTAGLG
jgi:hypothetical protein